MTDKQILQLQKSISNKVQAVESLETFMNKIINKRGANRIDKETMDYIYKQIDVASASLYEAKLTLNNYLRKNLGWS